MKTQVVDITPDLAQSFLRKNTGNFRALSKDRIAQYSKAIEDGCWDLTGQPIVFNGDMLLDGQHRLHAVIRAGKSMRSLVVWGAETDGMHIDSGQPRTFSQWLKHEGVPQSTQVAGVTKIANQWLSGRWGDHGSYGVATHQLVEIAKKYQEPILGAVRLTGGSRKAGIGLQHTLVAAVLLIGCDMENPQGNDEAVYFAQKLASGELLGSDEPVYLLRQAALKANASSERKWSRRMQQAMITLAWNKTLLGESVRLLKWTTTGKSKMAFPAVLRISDFS